MERVCIENLQPSQTVLQFKLLFYAHLFIVDALTLLAIFVKTLKKSLQE